MSRQPWAEVRRALVTNEIAKSEAVLTRLKRFTELLIQWNRSVSNLISKNDEDRIVASHVLPSIEVVGWMKSMNLKRWCDLGSGGGFPAIPLAICGLGESWDLIESRRTKTLFLQRAKGELGLSGVRVLPARIEDLLADLSMGPRADSVEPETEEEDVERGSGSEDFSRPPLHPPYDGFTSRATLALGPTMEYSAPIVRSGGVAFLWKGSRLAEEAASAPGWRAHWDEGEVRTLSIEHSVVASFLRNNEK